MAEKPDFVASFQRPQNTEIKHIRNNWYLYERFSRYDPVKKRSQKISGKCLGKITPDGLVPTKRRLTSDEPAQISSPMPASTPSDVVEVGGSLFLMGRTHEMLARLQKYFPDLWQRIYVTALLRALREPYFRRLQVHYETSFWLMRFRVLPLRLSRTPTFFKASADVELPLLNS